MLDTTLPPAEQCTKIWQFTRQQRKDEDRIRQEPPIVRLWDAEWSLQHVISGIEYEATFAWISNDVGPGQIEIPFEHAAAKWIHDSDGRVDRGEGRGVHITVDYCQARWSGRLEKSVVETREDGDTVMVLTFAHDYLELSYINCWSNPYTSSAVQAPKAWVLGGPVDWILLNTLHANLFRIHNPLLTVPDDPTDFDSWDTPLDMSDWPMVVKPLTFVDAMKGGTMWGLVSSRWQTWSDLAKVMLDDSELSVVCTRYLDGDPLPWDDANIRHGTLVISIEDKSGVMVGTAHGGSVWDGLRRTFAQFGEDFLESTSELLSDSDLPESYFIPGHRLTDKEFPYVVYRTGEGSGIESSKFINSPAKGVTIAMGGKSMPGVNEILSVTISALGDIWGNLLFIGSLGGTIDGLLKPMYSDVFLAWQSVKMQTRAQNAGWSRYEEHFQDVGGSSSAAYTITSWMVLRAGAFATRTVLANEMQVRDSPWCVGGPGYGHYFIDDRIGFVLENDPTGKVWMDRAKKIELKWGSEEPPEFIPTIGDPRNLQDPAQRALGKIEDMIGSLREIGVWTAVVVAGVSTAAALALTSHSRLDVQALNLASVNSALPAQPATSGRNVGVIGGELMPAKTVSFGDVPVDSMTDLVNRVFTGGAPSQVGGTVVGLDSVDVAALMPGGRDTSESL